MLNTSGLDLANSPPFDVPMRFFLVAPVFALAAGLLLALGPGSALASRWTPTALAVTHLLLVGFVSNIMCGSLLQILPVFVGAPLAAGRRTSAALMIALAMGITLLAAGFTRSSHLLLLEGGSLVAISLSVFAILVARALLAVPATSPFRPILLTAAVALGATVTLGMGIVAGQFGVPSALADKAWTDLHLTWGLAGWMGLLLIGIAAQLVPMFYLAPAPPRWLQRVIAVCVSVLLLGLLSAQLLGGERPVQVVLRLGVLLAFCGLVVTSFISQFRRRRPRRDSSLWFWWLGQTSILLAGVAWAFNAPGPLMGILLIVGAGMSITTGTLFKIVPFLCWYHLQIRKVRLQRSDVRLPTMHGFISERPARWQLLLHGASLALLILATWKPTPMLRFGAVLLAISAILLWITLFRAWWTYRQMLTWMEYREN